jgi:hypothetical protein
MNQDKGQANTGETGESQALEADRGVAVDSLGAEA